MSGALRLATRGSRLARWQTDHVAAALARLHPSLVTEIVEIRTTGDVITDVPLSKIGSSSYFTREIEAALLADEADVAVHSLKDLASQDVAGLRLASVLTRADARDALLSRGPATLESLPRGARVGTSSVRRQALLRSLRPDLELLDLRGNVPTRVRKLDEDAYDAIVLATAGLERLGMGDRITERLDPDLFVPAAGQGAIGLQTRSDDERSLAMVAALEDADTRVAVDAERSLLAELQVGCQAPVGVHARVDAGALTLRAVIASSDGARTLRGEARGAASDPEALGRSVAEDLRSRGAVELLKTSAAADGR